MRAALKGFYRRPRPVSEKKSASQKVLLNKCISKSALKRVEVEVDGLDAELGKNVRCFPVAVGT